MISVCLLQVAKIISGALQPAMHVALSIRLGCDFLQAFSADAEQFKIVIAPLTSTRSACGGLLDYHTMLTNFLTTFVALAG